MGFSTQTKIMRWQATATAARTSHAVSEEMRTMTSHAVQEEMRAMTSRILETMMGPRQKTGMKCKRRALSKRMTWHLRNPVVNQAQNGKMRFTKT